jgi:ribonuclease HI
VKTLKIYTDGSCLRNPGGAGGYCAVITDGEKKAVIKGGEKETTNNRMELMAVIKALEKIKNNYHIEIYSDSRYVVEGINSWMKKWKKWNWDGIANKDLWIRIDALLQKHISVKAIWIKGHNGHPENEYCDKIAKKEARMVMSEERRANK